MKVIKVTGLVPIKALVRFQNHKAGTVFGVTPERARKALMDKEAELFPIPEGYETFDVPDLIPAPNEAPAEPEPKEAGEVDIPADWESMQWLKRVKLAQDITGEKLAVAAGAKPADVADEIIRNEVQRRAAAVTPPAN